MDFLAQWHIYGRNGALGEQIRAAICKAENVDMTMEEIAEFFDCRKHGEIVHYTDTFKIFFEWKGKQLFEIDWERTK